MRRARRRIGAWALVKRSLVGGACLAVGAVACLVAGGLYDSGFVAATLTCYAVTLACLAGVAWSLVGED